MVKSMFFNNKRVLVTGGTGFVGAHIVESLLAKGAQIRIPIHKRPGVFNSKSIETVQADLTQYEDCLAAVKGIDYIFHAAGAVGAASVSAMDSMGAITTNLMLTARILHAAWKENVERILIYRSSTGYPAADYPIKEEEMWNEEPHPSYFGYGWMRRYLEKIGEFVASKSSTKVAIVRPSAVYGRNDNFDTKTGHVIPSLIRRAVEKENPFVVWGAGNEVRDFLHVSDLAEASLLMLEKYATADPVNIGYGKTFTIKEIVYLILKASQHHNADVVFDSSKPTAIPYRALDISKAKMVLGFEPKISLEQGLKDTVAYYQHSISGQ
jgi:GDP-L-fucose synthase